MANRYSENLPEVVPDSSPQPLTAAEAYERRAVDEGEKYIVVYDKDTPKVVTSPPFVGDVETPTTPAPAYRAPVDGAAVAVGEKGGVAPDVEGLGKSEAALGPEKGGQKILGLKRRTFFIALIIAVIVIAAAVGGGIGGSQAAAKQKASGASGASESADSAEVAEEASSPTESSPGETNDTISSPSGSSTPEPSDDDSSDDESSGKPTKTKTSSSASPKPTSGGSGGGSGGSKDDKDDDDEEEEKDKDKDDDDDDDDDRPKPGFTFRGWKNANFKGKATDIVATTGFLDLPFDVTSYKWAPKGTDCCITMCQGKKKDVGWRCTSFDREKSSAKFGRIFIGCGAEASQESSRCS